MTKKDKHRKLMTLLSKAGIDEEQRHELVHAWTGGRTESTRDLYDNEIDDLVWKFTNDYMFRENPKQATEAIKLVAIKEKRATVLAIATRVGIKEPEDFKRFNSFMENRSVLKKRLNKYTFEELDELVQQMHALEANFKASAEKAYTKAWHVHYKIPETSKN